MLRNFHPSCGTYSRTAVQVCRGRFLHARVRYRARVTRSRKSHMQLKLDGHGNRPITNGLSGSSGLSQCQTGVRCDSGDPTLRYSYAYVLPALQIGLALAEDCCLCCALCRAPPFGGCGSVRAHAPGRNIAQRLRPLRNCACCHFCRCLSRALPAFGSCYSPCRMPKTDLPASGSPLRAFEPAASRRSCLSF
jgi:hypothetical protein